MIIDAPNMIQSISIIFSQDSMSIYISYIMFGSIASYWQQYICVYIPTRTDHHQCCRSSVGVNMCMNHECIYLMIPHSIMSVWTRAYIYGRHSDKLYIAANYKHRCYDGCVKSVRAECTTEVSHTSYYDDHSDNLFSDNIGLNHYLHLWQDFYFECLYFDCYNQ